MGAVVLAASVHSAPNPPVPGMVGADGKDGFSLRNILGAFTSPDGNAAIENLPAKGLAKPLGGYRRIRERVYIAAIAPAVPENSLAAVKAPRPGLARGPAGRQPSHDDFDAATPTTLYWPTRIFDDLAARGATDAAVKLGLPPIPRPRARLVGGPALAALARGAAMKAPDAAVAARFDLAMVRTGQAPVPRLFRAKLPANLARLGAASARKRAFIETLLPLLLQANHRVLADRERLLALLAHLAGGGQLDSQDMDWLAKLADDFEVDLSQPGALAELKRRVDSVPPSLALAQAAEESGWGTSRFALQGNAVFGQRTWKKGRGIVPRRRDRGKRHEVKVFANLWESVSAYLWNLNTHAAYAALRAERAKMRRRGLRLDGYALAGTLVKYSERRARYVDTIRGLIRTNRLDQFDTARLQAPHMALLRARPR